jgi:hypothetical protein
MGQPMAAALLALALLVGGGSLVSGRPVSPLADSSVFSPEAMAENAKNCMFLYQQPPVRVHSCARPHREGGSPSRCKVHSFLTRGLLKRAISLAAGLLRQAGTKYVYALKVRLHSPDRRCVPRRKGVQREASLRVCRLVSYHARPVPGRAVLSARRALMWHACARLHVCTWSHTPVSQLSFAGTGVARWVLPGGAACGASDLHLLVPVLQQHAAGVIGPQPAGGAHTARPGGKGLPMWLTPPPPPLLHAGGVLAQGSRK